MHCSVIQGHCLAMYLPLQVNYAQLLSCVQPLGCLFAVRLKQLSYCMMYHT